MRLALLLLASCAVIGGLVWFTYSKNQSSLARLEGQVLKVRTYPLDTNSTLAILDFRVKNPGDQAFVVDKLQLVATQGQGADLNGSLLTKSDIDQVFAYQKLTGPQYNKTLGALDRIEAAATDDRMVVAHFDVPEALIEARTGLRLSISEIDGDVSEIAETRANKK